MWPGILLAGVLLGSGTQRFHLEKRPALECVASRQADSAGRSWPGMHTQLRSLASEPGLGPWSFFSPSYSFVSFKNNKSNTCT